MVEQNKGNIILYQTPDGQSKIEVTLSGDTVWLTADQMAELFQRNKSTISRHIKNVFEEGELQSDRGCVVIRVYGTASDFLSSEVIIFFRRQIFEDFPQIFDFQTIKIGI